MTKITYIPGEIACAAIDGNGKRKPVTRTQHIFDDAEGKSQAEVNAETEQRVSTLEESVGTGGSVDERIAVEGAKHYLKSETYSKSQLDNMITTPEIDYKDYDTYADMVAETNHPAGAIYRVANYDGTQIVTNKYAEYSWDGTQYRLMAVRDHGIDDEPTAGSNNLVKSKGVNKDMTNLFSRLIELTDDTFDTQETQEGLWEVGGYNNNGEPITSTTSIRTPILEKLPYDRIYNIGKYHATGYYLAYNADGSFVYSQLFKYADGEGGKPVIDIRDKYTKYAIYFYVGTGATPSWGSDITKYTFSSHKLALYNDLVSLKNSGYLFVGIATPNSTPIDTEENVFYIALDKGTYTNFGNINVNDGITILKKNNSVWSDTNVLLASEYLSYKDIDATHKAKEIVSSSLTYKGINDSNNFILGLFNDIFYSDVEEIDPEWEIGSIDNNGEEASDTSSIRTKLLTKSQYDKISCVGIYSSTATYFGYDENDVLIVRKLFRFQTAPGNTPVVESCDNCTKYRISIYMGQGDVSRAHNVKIQRIAPKTLSEKEINLAQTINASRIWDKYIDSNVWSFRGTSYALTSLLEKAEDAPIIVHCLQYSASLAVYFYNRATDEEPDDIVNLNGSNKFILSTVIRKYKYFKIQLYYSNIANIKSIEDFNEGKVVPFYTFVEKEENNDLKISQAITNIVAEKSIYDSTLNELKEALTVSYFNNLNSGHDVVAQNIILHNQSEYEEFINSNFLSNVEEGIVNIIFDNCNINVQAPIYLAQVNKPNVTLNFISNKATIRSFSNVYKRNDAIGYVKGHYILPYTADYSHHNVYLDDKNNQVQICDTGIAQSDGCDVALSEIIEVINSDIDTDERVFRFAVPEKYSIYINKNSDYFKDSYLYHSSTFTRIVSKIHKFERDATDSLLYVYISCLGEVSDFYTKEQSINAINSRYSYSGYYAPFYIVNPPELLNSDSVTIYNGNIYIPNYIDSLYECDKEIPFINIQDCVFKEINISGFEFIGGRSGNYNLIWFKNVSSINISNNNFKYINSYNVINIGSDYTLGLTKDTSSYNAENIDVCDNTFVMCRNTAIRASAQNLKILRNNCDTCGSITYRLAVVISGIDFIVANNIIKNFTWGGATISAGTTKKIKWINGVFENNIIYNDNKWNSQLDRNVLMDSGGLYLYVNLDDVHVRNNIIHDIYGKYQNRGIYGDNGINGAIVYNNLIYNIQYNAIDLYRVNWNSDRHSIGYPTNVNNICLYNIVFGKILVQNALSSNISEAQPIKDWRRNINGVNYIGKIVSSIVDGTMFKDENYIFEEDAFMINDIVYTKVDFSNWGFSDFILSRIRRVNDKYINIL